MGIVFENRGSQNFAQQSSYFAVEAEQDDLPLLLTEKERRNGIEIQWHLLEAWRKLMG